MIAAMTKGLLCLIIWLAIEGATTPFLTPLLILALCIRWLIKNRHNLTTGGDND